MAKGELVYGPGRGPHVAGHLTGGQACCQRPILFRTGKEAKATTPGLCPICRKAAFNK